MAIQIRAYTEADILAMNDIWNEVVEDGMAFPQLEYLTEDTGRAFFAEQTFTGVAFDTETDEVVGLYILHP
ncbi:MAG: GNAT family N-acetyltransferase, partial [Peptococcaceae bacterium]|nr:GNAT family N-acetyltransferase [Peptococcaceae bacterium]